MKLLTGLRNYWTKYKKNPHKPIGSYNWTIKIILLPKDLIFIIRKLSFVTKKVGLILANNKEIIGKQYASLIRDYELVRIDRMKFIYLWVQTNQSESPNNLGYSYYVKSDHLYGYHCCVIQRGNTTIIICKYSKVQFETTMKSIRRFFGTYGFSVIFETLRCRSC